MRNRTKEHKLSNENVFPQHTLHKTPLRNLTLSDIVSPHVCEEFNKFINTTAKSCLERGGHV